MSMKSRLFSGLNEKFWLFSIAARKTGFFMAITGTKQAARALWLSCVACFEMSAILYADNDAVLLIIPTIWRWIAPLAEYTLSASYGAPAAGNSIPKGLSSRADVAVLEVSMPKKQLVRLLAQTLSRFYIILNTWTIFGIKILQIISLIYHPKIIYLNNLKRLIIK